MTHNKIKIAAYGVTAAITFVGMFSNTVMEAGAVKLSEVLPAAGIGLTLSNGDSLANIQKRALAAVDQDKNLRMSISELKVFLEEKKAVPGKTVMDVSLVKQPQVHQALAEVKAEKEGVQPTEENVVTTVASIGGTGISAAPAEKKTEEAPEADVKATEIQGPSAEEKMGEAPETLASDTTVTSGDVVSSGTESAESSLEQAGTTTQPDMAETVSGNNTEAAGESAGTEEIKIEETQSTAEVLAGKIASMSEEEREFSNLVIAKVSDYVNVRSDASEESEIVGKLYDKSVGTFIQEKDGWYEINSGNVTGYVKGEYCVTGSDAVELAKEVGTRFATVTTTTLKVREEASMESAVLGLVPIEEELSVVEEMDGWVKVDIEEGYGWVSTEYVSLHTEFVKAESKAEEEARLAKEAEERRKARAAAANSEKPTSGNKSYNSASSYIPAGSGSASGNAVAQFALQFKGNPYVYGGSSLTNGTDCSGFVMSVYKNFGVSLPHSSSADRSVGSGVGSLAEAQPGDIICYSGHVGLYIGGGQIVHASNSRTGIIVSNAGYRNILAIRRIF